VDRLERCTNTLLGLEHWLRKKLVVYGGTSVEEEYQSAILKVRNVRDELAIEREERRAQKAESG